jgi:hypothetical protein
MKGKKSRSVAFSGRQARVENFPSPDVYGQDGKAASKPHRRGTVSNLAAVSV